MRDHFMELCKEVINGKESRFLFFLSIVHISGFFNNCKVTVSVARGGDINISIKSNKFPKLKWFYFSHTSLPTTSSGAVLTQAGLLHSLTPIQYENITTKQELINWLSNAIVEGSKLTTS